MYAKGNLNLTMLCDFYELTMGNGYFEHGYGDRITYFDLFFRNVPDNGGFAIAAGWSRRSIIFGLCTLAKRTLLISGPANCLMRAFWTIYAISDSQAMVFAVPEVRPYFPGNRCW
jgi:nicotinate phosphoribosyltransferase